MASKNLKEIKLTKSVTHTSYISGNEGPDDITMNGPGVNVRSRGGGVGGNIRK